ncbi:MAG: WYL domain-containing protein [Spirochaetaceae bacterium]|jgi:predicted DNA-binding transcriptional regulator YafY|nr:WYL domain-containing protein [Spirochaetaceae bacterium]
MKAKSGKLTVGALQRILTIDRLIAGGQHPNAKRLAKRLECSQVQVYRDIGKMKDYFNAPIEYDSYAKGYYYTEKTYRIPSGFTGAKDLAALAVIKSLIAQYRDNPMYSAVTQLLDSITTSYDDEHKNDWFAKRIVAPPVASAHIDELTWNRILLAMQKNVVITFDYLNAGDSEYKLRHTRPYQLLYDNNAWYLYCHDNDRKAARIFSLTRIKNIRLTETTFKLPDDYNYCKITEGSFFGVFKGEKYKFKINFYGYAATLVEERMWAKDQKIKAFDTGDSEKGITISFTSSQYDKVLEWVLSRGCFAKPLAPDRLVEDWKVHAKTMVKMAKNS